MCHLPRRWLFSRAHTYFSHPTICGENEIYDWRARTYSKEMGKEEFRGSAAFAFQLVGSLSNNDSDGYENITYELVNSRCLKLYRAYSISFNSSNVGNFLLDLNFKELYQSSRKEKESCCLVFTSSTKRETRHFHVLRNVPKSVMYVQSCCFANKTCCFFAVLVAVAVVFAQAP